MKTKLPKRHPANYVFERYKSFHYLVMMGHDFSVSNLQKNQKDSPEIVVWKVANGMRIGILASLAEVLQNHAVASEEFYREIMPILNQWIKEYPNWTGCNIDGTGIWGGEMEATAEMRIKGMWHRFLSKQKRRSQLVAYAEHYTMYLLQVEEAPSSNDYGIHGDLSAHLRHRVAKSLEHFGSDFDVSKMFVEDLL